MRKVFLILLLIFPSIIFFQIYFLDKDYFLCPINYTRDYVIRNDSRGYGYFSARRSNGSRTHAGVDLSAEINTPVVASRSGRVTAARHSKGMGNHVVIQHGLGLVTVYGHLQKIYVRDHQFVRQGQMVGSVGKTGNANHPQMQAHLHFEIRKRGIPEDPLVYFE